MTPAGSKSTGIIVKYSRNESRRFIVSSLLSMPSVICAIVSSRDLSLISFRRPTVFDKSLVISQVCNFCPYNIKRARGR